MSRALDKLLVVDLTTEFWGSLGAALLADFGADVIRVQPLVDPPGSGAREEDDATPWDYRAELAQRNKRSLAIDLDQDAGKEILRGLVRQADVFLTDWPMARLEEEGWDYESLSAQKADLIYARGTGFGPEGPDRDLPALDELAAARTGVMPTLPQPGEPPVYANAGPMYTSVMLALGVTLALHHREETGEGQEVDASLLGGNMYGASLDLQAFLAMGGERFLGPIPRTDAGNPMSGVLYPAEDGRWVCLTLPDTDRWWPGLADMLGIDPDDSRFNSHEKRCETNRLELLRVLEESFARKPSSHWKMELTTRQLSADVIEEFDYPAADAQAYRNRYLLELERPGVGRVKTLGFPVHMSESPARLRQPAPCRGQHTAEILHERMDFSEERITELMEQGVVG